VAELFHHDASRYSSSEPDRRRGVAEIMEPESRKPRVGEQRPKALRDVRAVMRGLRMSKRKAEKQALVIEAIGSGMSRMGAAADAGIARSTLYQWIDGEPAFRDKLDQAEARFEKRTVRTMEQAANRGSWKAAAWLAERRLPDRFRAKTEIELSGSVGGDGRYARLGAELEALSDTELTARIRSDLFEQLGELVAAGDEELIGEL
jgi:hypothetical protein